MKFYDLVEEGMAEANKAMKKFPQPNYVISKLAEEAGEVVKAAIHCAEDREDYENLRKEMVQLIAMLYRLWVEGDQVHGLRPVRKNPEYIKGAITAYYGPRCPSFVPECPTCEVWKLYDEMVEKNE